MKTSTNHNPFLLFKNQEFLKEPLMYRNQIILKPINKTLQLNSSAYSCIKNSLNAELAKWAN